jgi:hypothetical protein
VPTTVPFLTTGDPRLHQHAHSSSLAAVSRFTITLIMCARWRPPRSDWGPTLHSEESCFCEAPWDVAHPVWSSSKGGECSFWASATCDGVLIAQRLTLQQLVGLHHVAACCVA